MVGLIGLLLVFALACCFMYIIVSMIDHISKL